MNFSAAMHGTTTTGALDEWVVLAAMNFTI